MDFDASDEEQLLGATARGRCLFTFNASDFSVLARRYDRHAGLVLAAQSRWSLSSLIAALDRMLSTTTAEEWVGRVQAENSSRPNGTVAGERTTG
jgi:hypothetical protein